MKFSRSQTGEVITFPKGTVLIGRGNGSPSYKIVLREEEHYVIERVTTRSIHLKTKTGTLTYSTYNQ